MSSTPISPWTKVEDKGPRCVDAGAPLVEPGEIAYLEGTVAEDVE